MTDRSTPLRSHRSYSHARWLRVRLETDARLSNVQAREFVRVGNGVQLGVHAAIGSADQKASLVFGPHILGRAGWTIQI